MSKRRVGARLRIVAGALAATMLLAGCGIGLQDLPIGGSAGAGAISVTVQLESAIGLVHGAEVRFGQKVVGRISDMQVGAHGADVQVSLAGDLDLAADTAAVVELPTALGTPHIRLLDPDTGGPRLADGDVIALSVTELGPRIESTLAGLGMLLDGGGVGRLETVVAELHTAFDGRAEQMAELTDFTADLLERAHAGREDFDAAVTAAAAVAERAAESGPLIDRGLDQVPDLVAVLAGQQQTLDDLLGATADLAAVGAQITAAAPDQMSTAATDAAAVVAALQDFSDRLAAGLDGMNRFMADFGRAVRGDYLTFVGTLDVPGTIDSLFFGPDGPPVPRERSEDGRKDPFAVFDDIATALDGGVGR